MKNEASQIELSVSLAYRTFSQVGANHWDYSGYIQSVTAEISGYTHLENQEPRGREIVLGELKFYVIRVSNAVNDDVPLHDMFQTHQETYEAGDAIFDSAFKGFRSVVQKRFTEACFGYDILLLHSLTIKPFARGQRLGLAVLHQAIRDWWNGCSLVVMKPFPLQLEAVGDSEAHNKRFGLEGFPTAEREAFRRLRRYCEQVGFERIGRSKFYALCPNEMQPTKADLDLPDLIEIPVSAIELEGVPVP